VKAPARLALGSTHTRALGVLITLVLVLLLLHTDGAAERGLRYVAFDSYQRKFPRERLNDSVIVMAIDDLSLQRRGQWPWPRRDLAELVDRLAALDPAAIGIDMIFAEPDRQSPRRQAERLQRLGYLGRQPLSADLPDYDQLFAQSLRRAPVALGVGGLHDDPRLIDPPDYRAPLVEVGAPAAPFLRRFPSVLRSIEVIDRAAAGHGAINAEAQDGVVRNVPALIEVGGHVLPSLAVEVLRQTSDDPIVRVQVDEQRGVRQLEVAGHTLPLERDGTWWIHFSDPQARPIFPVESFLDGTLPPELITGRIVLIGAAAGGLQDRVITPAGAMPGVSVHAEALDNALDGRLLWRPYWAAGVEAALLAMLGLVCVIAVPALRPLNSVLVFALMLALVAAIGAGAFVGRGWLIDVASPMATASLVFAVMLSIALGQTQLQRRGLRRALAVTRERQARIAGELDAARRIQSGMLPDAGTVLGADPRVDLAATMVAARTVGGDLYDFFRLDDGRLFFLVGDVSDKGLAASLFMALSKALIKNAVMEADGTPGAGLSRASRQLSRENPETMFVTVVAGALDLSSGELAWCSAGHDGPYVVRAGRSETDQLMTEGGPALCMLDAFDYPTERFRLGPGDTLCLVTDGVTEARSAQDELYGAARLMSTLAIAANQEAGSARIVERLRDDVERFAAGREPADDLSILVLRWNGGSG
jgi:CHASE2 domain-containing sensor protein/serine phosphatase RsbU (regulator of sigma subunit)